MAAVIEELVGVVQQLIRTLEEGRDTQLSVSFREAARRLGFKSAKTISRMEQRGEIQSVLISGTKMISVAELQRVATPKQEKVRRGGAPKKVALSAKEEAAQMLADLKRR